jgi:hypothetical protein
LSALSSLNWRAQTAQAKDGPTIVGRRDEACARSAASDGKPLPHTPHTAKATDGGGGAAPAAMDDEGEDEDEDEDEESVLAALLPEGDRSTFEYQSGLMSVNLPLCLARSCCSRSLFVRKRRSQ